MTRVCGWFSVCILAFLMGCSSGAPKELKGSEGQTFYTQLNMWTYKDQHRTVNYGVDRLIPVNTAVKIRDIGGEDVEFSLLENGRELTLVNIEKYSREEMGEIFKRYFGRDTVSLDSFTAAEREAIAEGKVEKGMSKQAVLMARGYPPAHETPSIEDDQWKYWTSRFNTKIVYFENGKVSRIKD